MLTPTLVLGVSLCSAAGAVSRYLLDLTVRAVLLRRAPTSHVAPTGHVAPASRVGVPTTGTPAGRTLAPWGIGVVNATGAFALGLLSGVATTSGVSATTVIVLGTGFLGSYTTFSTFAVDTVRLWRAGRRLACVLNVVLTVAAGLVLVVAGYTVAS